LLGDVVGGLVVATLERPLRLQVARLQLVRAQLLELVELRLRRLHVIPRQVDRNDRRVGRQAVLAYRDGLSIGLDRPLLIARAQQEFPINVQASAFSPVFGERPFDRPARPGRVAIARLHARPQQHGAGVLRHRLERRLQRGLGLRALAPRQEGGRHRGLQIGGRRRRRKRLGFVLVDHPFDLALHQQRPCHERDDRVGRILEVIRLAEFDGRGPWSSTSSSALPRRYLASPESGLFWRLFFSWTIAALGLFSARYCLAEPMSFSGESLVQPGAPEQADGDYENEAAQRPARREGHDLQCFRGCRHPRDDGHRPTPLALGVDRPNSSDDWSTVAGWRARPSRLRESTRRLITRLDFAPSRLLPRR
jgi:hypothetical protein